MLLLSKISSTTTAVKVHVIMQRINVLPRPRGSEHRACKQQVLGSNPTRVIGGVRKGIQLQLLLYTNSTLQCCQHCEGTLRNPDSQNIIDVSHWDSYGSKVGEFKLELANLKLSLEMLYIVYTILRLEEPIYCTQTGSSCIYCTRIISAVLRLEVLYIILLLLNIL